MIEVAKDLTADIEVIFHPETVSKEEAAITLKVGDRIYENKSDTRSVVFKGIELPAGELRLEAIRRDGEQSAGAWHLDIQCNLD